MGEIALTVRSLWPSGSFLVMGSEMKDKGSSFNGDGRSKMGLGLKVFGWLNGLAAVMMFDDENGNVGVCSGLTWLGLQLAKVKALVRWWRTMNDDMNQCR
ncbi:hypothetical protein V6N11_034184 [Hibiscus sabdariffa]|uniref:Uncharacterized protein n=1 Tax=Hibiscus sabdariffa TaxID=183260 RepID=A0ABR2S244_9ROSI